MLENTLVTGGAGYVGNLPPPRLLGGGGQTIPTAIDLGMLAAEMKAIWKISGN